MTNSAPKSSSSSDSPDSDQWVLLESDDTGSESQIDAAGKKEARRESISSQPQENVGRSVVEETSESSQTFAPIYSAEDDLPAAETVETPVAEAVPVSEGGVVELLPVARPPVIEAPAIAQPIDSLNAEDSAQLLASTGTSSTASSGEVTAQAVLTETHRDESVEVEPTSLPPASIANSSGQITQASTLAPVERHTAPAVEESSSLSRESDQPSSQPLSATVASAAINESTHGDNAPSPAAQLKPKSWLFRLIGFGKRSVEFSFGLASLIVLLAVVTGFPLLQVLVLGYLLESSRRVVATGKIRACVPGWRRAARIGSLAVGTALCLLPIGYLSSLAEGAALVDPGGAAETRLRIGAWIATFLLVPHMLAAWFCGGKLRYFFWPVLAPFQLAIWSLQWILASKPMRESLDATLGKVCPNLVHDLCRVTPITDFFLPAIIGKHLWRGTLWAHMRDGFWNFLVGLKPVYLGWLGLRCLIGSVAWLVVPTLFLIGGTVLPEAGAVLTGAIGVVLLGIVCMYLPTQQTHFAVVGKFYAMFDWAAARDQILRSPVRHSLAMLLMLTLALPLYLLKIELIDPDLWWTLGLFFVAFSLPARWVLGWAYARSSRREKRSWFIWRWPVRTLALVPALIFALFVSVTRFLSWGGVSGLFEHHAFLVPAPFTFYF